MEPVEARGLIEQLAVSSLEQRGWTVIAAKRDTLDLDLSVAFDGTPGRILFRNGFTVEKGVAQVAEPAPCFVRVDLGEPSGEPERWALWDQYSFPGSREAPRYVALVIHEAIGKGWCSVAGNSVGPKVMWYDATKALDTILARAEALCPGRDEPDRREIIFEDQRENRGEQEERGKAVLGAVVFIVISLGLGGILLHEREQIGGADFPWIAIGIVGSIALVLLSVGVGILLSRFLASRKPIDGMDGLLDRLRSSGAFETFELSPLSKREGLPVVVRVGGILDEGRAPLWLSTAKAESASHPIRLEADLCHLRWPEGVSDEARFVPDRWLTIDLTGPEADLTKLPEGPREERGKRVVRWMLTGEELDTGVADDLFSRIAATFGASSGPYR